VGPLVTWGMCVESVSLGLRAQYHGLRVASVFSATGVWESGHFGGGGALEMIWPANATVTQGLRHCGCQNMVVCN
jgi:hypothetical protein